MFGLDPGIVRAPLVGIAQDYVARHLKGERKEQALAHVVAVLECWKIEQADTDGMVAAVPAPGRNALANAFEKGSRPVSDVRPWECMGDDGVRCDADLFVRLAYSGDYSPAKDAERTLGFGTAIALLVERDSMTMPIESLAYCVSYLWISASTTIEAYREELHHLGKKEAAATAQRLNASALGVAANRMRAESVKAEWRGIAAGFWREDSELKADAVAAMVVDELRQRGYKEKDLPRWRTVRDALNGLKATVRTDLARAAKRQKPT